MGPGAVSGMAAKLKAGTTCGTEDELAACPPSGTVTRRRVGTTKLRGGVIGLSMQSLRRQTKIALP